MTRKRQSWKEDRSTFGRETASEIAELNDLSSPSSFVKLKLICPRRDTPLPSIPFYPFAENPEKYLRDPKHKRLIWYRIFSTRFVDVSPFFCVFAKQVNSSLFSVYLIVFFVADKKSRRSIKIALQRLFNLHSRWVRHSKIKLWFLRKLRTVMRKETYGLKLLSVPYRICCVLAALVGSLLA